jgi:hypothetical protein
LVVHQPVVDAVYAIDAFPDHDLVWRIDWIGGIGYNVDAPSAPSLRSVWRGFPLASRIRSAPDRVPLKAPPSKREMTFDGFILLGSGFPALAFLQLHAIRKLGDPNDAQSYRQAWRP